MNASLLALWASSRYSLGREAAPSFSPASPAPRASAGNPQLDPEWLLQQVNPRSGHKLADHFGDLGPRMIRAGAIDPERFERAYQEAGRPLPEDQLTALMHGSEAPIVIDRESSHFLLNYLWALGLSNRSPLLEAGPLMTYSQGDIGRFASTGGWTLGARPATELFSSVDLIMLTPDQHELVERVASQVYRPCCNNHAAFPDCNHGMAMLGLLQLLASEGASEGEMFEAAKHANSFWFPQQAMELAAFIHVTRGLAYEQVAATEAVSWQLFSGSGFNDLHRWLADNAVLPEAPRQGGNCGV